MPGRRSHRGTVRGATSTRSRRTSVRTVRSGAAEQGAARRGARPSSTSRPRPSGRVGPIRLRPGGGEQGGTPAAGHEPATPGRQRAVGPTPSTGCARGSGHRAGLSREVGPGGCGARPFGAAAHVRFQSGEAQESIEQLHAGNGAETPRTPRWSKASKSHQPRLVNDRGARTCGDAGAATGGGERSGGWSIGGNATAARQACPARRLKPDEPHGRRWDATSPSPHAVEQTVEVATKPRGRNACEVWQPHAETALRHRLEWTPHGLVDGGAIFEEP